MCAVHAEIGGHKVVSGKVFHYFKRSEVRGQRSEACPPEADQRSEACPPEADQRSGLAAREVWVIEGGWSRVKTEAASIVSEFCIAPEFRTEFRHLKVDAALKIPGAAFGPHDRGGFMTVGVPLIHHRIELQS